MKMISPIHQIFPLVPDTVPSPPSRVQGRRRSLHNGQLLARDEGTAKSPKVPEVKSPRETELARNQITSNDVASSKGRILEEHTKVKNRWASVARHSKRMSLFVALASESLQNIFAVPADIFDATLSKSTRELCNNATHRFSNQIGTDAFTWLAENRVAAPPSVAQHTPGRHLPVGVAGMGNRTSGGGGLERKHESPWGSTPKGNGSSSKSNHEQRYR
jgi:hypothetical protein